MKLWSKSKKWNYEENLDNNLCLDKKQINLLYNYFFKKQLSYCPLIWTFCSRRSTNLINKLQERAWRVVYSNYGSIFNKFLEIANENTIHIKNINILMREIYEFWNGLSPPKMSEILKKGLPRLLKKPKLINNPL